MDGVAFWADFFKHVIELYRDNIRAQIAFVGNHVWPFGKLPAWFFDVLLIYGILLLSVNLAMVKIWKTTLFGVLFTSYKEDIPIYAIRLVILAILLWPILAVLVFLFERRETRLLNMMLSAGMAAAAHCQRAAMRLLYLIDA